MNRRLTNEEIYRLLVEGYCVKNLNTGWSYQLFNERLESLNTIGYVNNNCIKAGEELRADIVNEDSFVLGNRF